MSRPEWYTKPLQNKFNMEENIAKRKRNDGILWRNRNDEQSRNYRSANTAAISGGL